MRNNFKNTTDVIEKLNTSLDKLRKCNDDDIKKDIEVVENIDFEIARALILDCEDVAVKAAKMILAHKDINDVKVKFE